MSGNQFDPSVLEISGKSLGDCKSKLYMQYGSDYDIVDYRVKPKGGFFGFFQKEYVVAKYVLKNRSQEQKQSFPQTQEELLKSAGIEKDTLVQAKFMKQQLDEFKSAVLTKMDTIAKNTSITDKHPTIEKIEQLLAENEFTLSYINSISARIKAEFPLSELEDFDAVQRTVVDWIGQSLKIEPKPMYVKVPHVTVLVGPTGVGKTTTIAKIAANYIREAKDKERPVPNIRMITTDSFKIGSESQLKTYADIMSIPVDKAQFDKDIKQIFDTYRNSVDEIIIDTSGYSPNDYESIGKLRSLLDVPGLHPDVFLTVMASTKASDLAKIIQNYETFNFSSVILTKCDETSAYGNVISVLAEKNKSVSYITTGQRVPRDFEKADVIYFLTRLVDFNIDRVHIDDLFGERTGQ